MSVPRRLVDNDELAARLGIDAEWIRKRTGTGVRPWASADERLDEHAASAARAALARAGVRAGELDLIVVATTTADEMSPNTAPLVAGLIGAGRASAVDVGAACTGFLSGLSLVAGQIESGRAERVLLIGADLLSRHLDPTDRDTAVLFADGAGAAVLVRCAPEDPERLGPVVLHADPAGSGMIGLPRGGRITMDGRETFRAAVEALTEVTGEAAARAGIEIGAIGLFVYHQANSRIIRAVGERLGLDPSRVVDYVERFGNMSAATIPVALVTAQQEGRLPPDSPVLLAAFGAGFTWGATVLHLRPS
jgi:3-oxoacyl-[acyl-carrier-protein] synthase-3